MSSAISFVWVFVFLSGVEWTVGIRGQCNLILRFPSIETPLFPTRLGERRSMTPLLETGLKPFFSYPKVIDEETQSLRMSSGKAITLTCPGKNNGILNKDGVTRRLSCSRAGKSFMLENEKVSEDDVACRRRPKGCLLHTKMSCQGDRQGTLHVIGWRIEEGWFIPQVTVCWDKAKETTVYTRHVIYGSFLKHRIASSGRPEFAPGTLYSQKIQNLYKRSAQLETFGAQLGDVSRIPGSKNYYFARGHLAPDADFVLPAEQDATYFYSNVVPQFQTFNNGNWKVMEANVRALAERRNHSLVVFTGTMATPLALKDVNGNDVPMFLDPQMELYPVPLVMWKVIHDPLAKEVIALLGLNLLEDDEAQLESFLSLCDDICDQLDWATWNSKDWKRGALLCCSWNQFKRHLPKLANFGSPKLLNG